MHIFGKSTLFALSVAFGLSLSLPLKADNSKIAKIGEDLPIGLLIKTPDVADGTIQQRDFAVMRQENRFSALN